MKTFFSQTLAERGKAGIIRLLFLFVVFSFFSTLLTPVCAIGTQGVLSGRVVDKDTGKGLDHVFITAKSPSDTYTGITDANGYFSIAGVPAGGYDVSIERVGYPTATYPGIVVTGDASTNLQFKLSSQALEVPGVTVTAPRAVIVNPRQTMTNYGYSTQEIKQIFPAAASNGLLPLYESLPGVGIGYDAYYGPATPHIRGGTGSDVAYAFDGVPTYEPNTNTYGTALNVVGTSRTDVYVGGYPAQYGNFLSGFVNQVAKRGSGPLHGNLEFQSGFWMDIGSQTPSYDTATGTMASYNGALPASPTNINIEIQGKDRKFSYYFNQLIQSGGLVSYPSGVDLKPYIAETGGLTSNQQNRDTVLNFNYDLDAYNGLQLLYYTGIQKLNFVGYQELPCNPNDIGPSCLGTSTATGFGETYNAFNIAQLPDMFQIGNYDLEKFEWTHRFQSPGKVVNLRAWRFNPTVTFDYFTSPLNSRWQFRRSAENGLLLEYQDQLTPKHLLDTGASYIYSNNFLLSDKNNIGAPTAPASYLASGNLVQYPFVTGSSGGFSHLHTQAVPDTLTQSAWLTDEWRPTPKWDVYAGLRADRQVYMILPGINGNPFALGIPGYATGSPLDSGLTKPAFISPRAGASYKLADKLTMKASYGKFVTFAPARRVERITGFLDSNATAYTQGISSFASGFTLPPGTIANTGAQAYGSACPDTAGCYRFPVGVAESLSGSRPQIGESIDVSWEYQLNDTSYLKLTPYLKHIKDPLESYTVNGVTNFVNAGTIVSKGIELFLKSRDWHGVSGWLSYTYSSTRGSQLPFQTDLASNPVYFCSPGNPTNPCSANAPFSTSIVTADANQMVPLPYDQRHVVSLNLDVRAGNWEFAPNFTYGSGFPYGLGLHNLQALAELMDSGSILYGGTRGPVQSAAFLGFTNPLGENGFNGLRQPGWWLGNLAVTYHINPNVDAVLSVFNLFNSSQVLNIDNSVLAGVGYPELTNSNLKGSVVTSGNPCCYTSQDATANILPQYNPLKGQYAPLSYPNLRQFYFTLNYKL